MLFRWSRGPDTSAAPHAAASDELRRYLSSAMPDASKESAAVVGAVAGLLAFVAYADRAYGPEEQRAVRDALSRVHDLPAHAIDGVTSLLSSRVGELAAEPLHDFTRVLSELTERDARLELLDVLMDLAAADAVLSMDETNSLRRIAKLLGLSDHDYLASQARHRERLSVLDVR